MVTSVGFRSTVAKRAVVVSAAMALALLTASCELTSNDMTGVLSGRVMVAGGVQPIASAVVECEGEFDVSDGGGYYRIEGLPTGETVIQASAAGFEDYSQIVTVTESSTHDIRMEVHIGSAKLSGYVSHASLGPIEGATVRLEDMEVTTDAEGFYEYENVQQVSYEIAVTKDGYRDYIDHSLFVASEDFQHDIELKKLASVTLTPVADAALNERAAGQNTGDEAELNLYNDYVGHWALVIAFGIDLEETSEPVSADLMLYNTAEEGVLDPRPIQVARILEPWAEMSVKWEDDLGTTGPSAVDYSYESRWYSIDVSDYVRDWLVGGSNNYGLWVDTPLDNDASRLLIASREYGDETKRPRIELVYAW